jgi:Periplasmic component of the Tol biopolymer transport system
LRISTALRRVVFLTAAGAIVACGDATGTHTPGLYVRSGADVSDTVLATLGNPLVIEIIDDEGAPLPGVVVRFQAVPLSGGRSPLWSRTWVALGDSVGRTGLEFIFDTTDSNGRATSYVQFGVVAGSGTMVTVNAPALGLDATAAFTIQPGAPAGVIVAPRDSAMYVGGSYALRGAVVDRWGNPRTDPVSYHAATTSSAVDLDATGKISAREIGRSYAVVTAGAWRDSAWVSVVPQGRIAAVRAHRITGDTAYFVLMNIDGTDASRFPINYWAQPRADWAPSGAKLVMEDGGHFGAADNHIVLFDADGTTHSIVDTTLGLQVEFYPQYSADGDWIYFAGGRPNLQGHTELWRVHPDGTGAERIGEAAGYYEGDTQPSPSPDGRHVAYTTDRYPCCYGLTVRVLDVETGAIDSLGAQNGTPLPGLTPRWSPVDANLIVYGNANDNYNNVYALTLYAMRPDGSGRHAITPPDVAVRPSFDWSPDGKWIIAQSFDTNALELIEVGTSRILPLGFTAGMTQPTWKP